MTQFNLQDDFEETFNPFEIKNDFAKLKENLNAIDDRCIRTKFKNTDDPITLAFETIENTSLKRLAQDFVKESFLDAVSFVTKICK